MEEVEVAPTGEEWTAAVARGSGRGHGSPQSGTAGAETPAVQGWTAEAEHGSRTVAAEARDAVAPFGNRTAALHEALRGALHEALQKTLWWTRTHGENPSV